MNDALVGGMDPGTANGLLQLYLSSVGQNGDPKVLAALKQLASESASQEVGSLSSEILQYEKSAPSLSSKLRRVIEDLDGMKKLSLSFLAGGASDSLELALEAISDSQKEGETYPQTRIPSLVRAVVRQCLLVLSDMAVSELDGSGVTAIRHYSSAVNSIYSVLTTIPENQRSRIGALGPVTDGLQSIVANMDMLEGLTELTHTVIPSTWDQLTIHIRAVLKAVPNLDSSLVQEEARAIQCLITELTEPLVSQAASCFSTLLKEAEESGAAMLSMLSTYNRVLLHPKLASILSNVSATMCRVLDTQLMEISGGLRKTMQMPEFTSRLLALQNVYIRSQELISAASALGRTGTELRQGAQRVVKSTVTEATSMVVKWIGSLDQKAKAIGLDSGRHELFTMGADSRIVTPSPAPAGQLAEEGRIVLASFQTRGFIDRNDTASMRKVQQVVRDATELGDVLQQFAYVASLWNDAPLRIPKELRCITENSARRLKKKLTDMSTQLSHQNGISGLAQARIALAELRGELHSFSEAADRTMALHKTVEQRMSQLLDVSLLTSAVVDRDGRRVPAREVWSSSMDAVKGLIADAEMTYGNLTDWKKALDERLAEIVIQRLQSDVKSSFDQWAHERDVIIGPVRGVWRATPELERLRAGAQTTIDSVTESCSFRRFSDGESLLADSDQRLAPVKEVKAHLLEDLAKEEKILQAIVSGLTQHVQLPPVAAIVAKVSHIPALVTTDVASATEQWKVVAQNLQAIRKRLDPDLLLSLFKKMTFLTVDGPDSVHTRGPLGIRVKTQALDVALRSMCDLGLAQILPAAENSSRAVQSAVEALNTDNVKKLSGARGPFKEIEQLEASTEIYKTVSDSYNATYGEAKLHQHLLAFLRNVVSDQLGFLSTDASYSVASRNATLAIGAAIARIKEAALATTKALEEVAAAHTNAKDEMRGYASRNYAQDSEFVQSICHFVDATDKYTPKALALGKLSFTDSELLEAPELASALGAYSGLLDERESLHQTLEIRKREAEFLFNQPLSEKLPTGLVARFEQSEAQMQPIVDALSLVRGVLDQLNQFSSMGWVQHWSHVADIIRISQESQTQLTAAEQRITGATPAETAARGLLRSTTDTLRDVADLQQLLHYIRGDIFTIHHWRELVNIMGAHRVAQAPEPVLVLKLGDLVAAAPALLAAGGSLSNLWSVAHSEHAVVELLQQTEQWMDRESTVVLDSVPLSAPVGVSVTRSALGSQAESYLPERTEFDDGTAFVAQQWSQLQAAITDHLESLDVLEDAPGIGPHRAQLDDVCGRLTDMAKFVTKAANVQTEWRRLEPILGKGVVSVELERFKVVSTLFVTIMRGLYAAQGCLGRFLRLPAPSSLLHYLNRPDAASTSLNTAIEDCAEQVSIIVTAVRGYLSVKREVFPRFFFVGDDDLLSLLSATATDPRAAEPFLPKIFQAVARLRMTGTNIEAIFSPEGEMLKLSQAVDTSASQPEVWLSRLEKVISATLHGQIRDGLARVKDLGTIFEFLPDMVAQVFLVVLGVQVSAAIDEALRTNGSLQAVYDLIHSTGPKACSALRSRGKSVSGIDGRALILKADGVATELSRWDRLIENLAKKRTERDIIWSKSIHYIASKSQYGLECYNSQINLGYEYIGLPSRLVHTSLTDSVYGVLMCAAQFGMGGSPEGPAGTGKTETVKALAALAGRQILVFNCDSSMRSDSVARILAGAALCGAWVCFDELNRLSPPELSAIADILTTLQEAIAAKHAGAPGARLKLGGVETDKFSTDTMVFFTMNPACRGYGGRSLLPASLQRLFRPVVMSKPDSADILAVSLSIMGFSDSHKLASLLVQAFEQIRRQVSSQRHYDFSLRALKAVLNAVSVLQHSAGDGKSSAPCLVARGLVVSLAPKLTQSDYTTVKRVTRTVFSGFVPDSDLTDEALTADVDTAFLAPAIAFLEQKYGTALPGHSEKILQLHQSLQQRSGSVVIGPPSSGKSAIIDGFLDAFRADLEAATDEAHYPSDGKLVMVHRLFPSSVDKAGLLGRMDISGGFIEGNLSSLCRHFADQAARDIAAGVTRHIFVILDGCIEPEWVEAMNSVLDDNACYTLPTGEAFRLQKDRVSFIFETDSLVLASPATVSRLGVVFTQMPTPTLSDTDLSLYYGAVFMGIDPALRQLALQSLQFVDKSRRQGDALPLLQALALSASQFQDYESNEVSRAMLVLEWSRAIECSTGVTVIQSLSKQFHVSLPSIPEAQLRGLSYSASNGFHVAALSTVTGNLVVCPSVVSLVGIIDRALMSRKTALICLTGPSGSGRASVARIAAAVNQGKPRVAELECSMSTRPDDLMTALSSITTRTVDRNGATVLAGSNGHTSSLLILRSIDAIKPEIPGNSIPTLEMIRGIATHGEAVDVTGDHSAISVTGVVIVCTTRSVAGLPRRLAANALVATVDATNDADLLKQVVQNDIASARSMATPPGESLTSLLLSMTSKSSSVVTQSLLKFVSEAQSVRGLHIPVLRLARTILSALSLCFIPQVMTEVEARETACSLLELIIGPIVPRAPGLRRPLDTIMSELSPKANQLRDAPLHITFHPEVIGLVKADRADSLAQLQRQDITLSAALLDVSVGLAFHMNEHRVVILCSKPGSGSAAVLNAAQTIRMQSRPSVIWVPSAVASASVQNMRDLFKEMLQDDRHYVIRLSRDLLQAAPYWSSFVGAVASQSLRQHLQVMLSGSDQKAILSDQDTFDAITRDRLRVLIEWMPATDDDQSLESYLVDWPAVASAAPIVSMPGLGDVERESDVCAQLSAGVVKMGGKCSDESIQRAATLLKHYVSHFRDSLAIPNSDASLLHFAISVFTSVYVSQQQKDEARLLHLRSGLEALTSTTKTVENLTADVEERRAKLAAAKEAADNALKSITASMEEAQKHWQEATEIQIHLKSEEEKASHQQAEAEKRLLEVQPMLDEARRSVAQIPPQVLSEMKSMRTPPVLVADVLTLMSFILPTSQLTKRAIQEFDPGRLKVDDQARAEKYIRKTLATHVDSIENAAKQIERSSSSARILWDWISAVLTSARVAKEVEPLQAAAATARQRLEAAQEELTLVQNKVNELHEKTAHLREEFDQKTREAGQLQQTLEEAEERLRAAQSLLDSVGSEKERWTEQESQLRDRSSNRVGWTVVQAIFAVFFAAKPEKDREKQMEMLCQSVFGAPQKMAFSAIACDSASLLEWRQMGLPEFSLAVDNAAAIHICAELPVITVVDGSGISGQWLRSYFEKDRKVITVSVYDPRLVSLLANVASFGQTLLLQCYPDAPLPVPVLALATALLDGTPNVTIGGRSILIAPSCHLVLLLPYIGSTTRDSLLFARAPLFNFCATETSTTDRLTAAILRLVRPDLAEMAEDALRKKIEARSLVFECENELLQALASAAEEGGDITTNRRLLTVLSSTREKAAQAAKLESLIRANTEQSAQVSSQLRPLCVMLSRVFFSLDSLGKIAPAYAVGLPIFTSIIVSAVRAVMKDGAAPSLGAITQSVCSVITTYLLGSLPVRLHPAIFMILGRYIQPDSLNEAEWMAWCDGAAQSTAPVPKWADGRNADNAGELLGSIDAQLLQTLSSQAAAAWGLSDDPESYPGQWPSHAALQSPWRRALVISALRPDRGVQAIEAAAQETLHPRATFTFQQLLGLSDPRGILCATNTRPLLILAPAGTDCVSRIQDATGGKTVVVSVSDGCVDQVRGQLMVLGQSGGTLAVVNVHLLPSLIEQVIQPFLAQGDRHADFRLILTSEDKAPLPAAFCADCLRLFLEPRHSLASEAQQAASSDVLKLPENARNQGFALIYRYLILTLFALLRGRLRAVPRGWTTAIPFDALDVTTAVRLVDATVTDKSKISLGQIVAFVRDVALGPRVSSPADQQILSYLVDAVICSDVFTKKPSPRLPFVVLPAELRHGVAAALAALPQTPTPAQLALYPSAFAAINEESLRQALATTRFLSGGTSGAATGHYELTRRVYDSMSPQVAPLLAQSRNTTGTVATLCANEVTVLGDIWRCIGTDLKRLESSDSQALAYLQDGFIPITWLGPWLTAPVALVGEEPSLWTPEKYVEVVARRIIVLSQTSQTAQSQETRGAFHGPVPLSSFVSPAVFASVVTFGTGGDRLLVLTDGEPVQGARDYYTLTPDSLALAGFMINGNTIASSVSDTTLHRPVLSVVGSTPEASNWASTELYCDYRRQQFICTVYLYSGGKPIAYDSREITVYGGFAYLREQN